MRLCIVSNTDLPAKWVGNMLGTLQPSFAKVLRPDTEVALKPAKGGLRGDNYYDFDHPYFGFLNDAKIVEGFHRGWQGRLRCCLGELLRRSRRPHSPARGRHADRRPRRGHPALRLPDRTEDGHYHPGPARDAVSDRGPAAIHGLESRLINNGIRSEPEPFEVAFAKGQKDPGYTVEAVSQVARGCVADGADVIVIACCGTGPLLSRAGFNKLVVGDQVVPVLDPMMVAAKMAETMADVRKGAGLPIPSRTRSHALPSEADWKRVRTLFGLPV